MAFSLRRNFSWTIAGNLVYTGCQWAMLVALAQLGNPEMVGQYALGLALTAPVVLFLNLQLRMVQATDAKRLYQFGDYLGLRLLTALLSLFVIAVVVLALGYEAGTSAVVLLVGVAKAVEAVSDVYYGLFQQRERMDLVSKSLLLRGVGMLVLFVLCLSVTGSVIAATAAQAAVWFLTLAVYDMKNGRRLAGTAETSFDTRPVFDHNRLWMLTRLALPMGIASMLTALNFNVPRYIIEHFLSMADLGIFAALAYFWLANQTVINALGQAASSRLATYYQSNRAAFKKLLVKLALLGGGLGAFWVLLVWLLGEPFLRVFYGPEYAAHNDVLLVLMIGSGISNLSSVFWYGATAACVYQAQVPLFAVMFLATTLTSWLLVPALGILGAAIAITVGYTLLALATLGLNLYALRKGDRHDESASIVSAN
jgi:O-antigen/teichoic acid export membrane protein